MGLIRMLMFLLAGLAIYALFRRLFPSSKRPAVNPLEPDERLGRLVQDPNCLEYVDSKEAVRGKVGGVEHLFCSTECVAAYRAAHRAKAQEEA